MAENTAITWAHDTFNPWEGCTRISPACDNCYAADRAHRFGNDHLWSGDLRRTSPANWRLPLKWDRQAAEPGTPRRVFCASLSDVFDKQAPQEWREDLWHLIEATPHLTWMLLTKRPQNVGGMIPARWKPLSGDGHVMPPCAPSNIWLGFTAEDQVRLDQRAFFALHVARFTGWLTFCSAEPLLGPLDFSRVAIPATIPGRINALSGAVAEAGIIANRGRSIMIGLEEYVGLKLIIGGGESGPNARAANPVWLRAIRDQCAAAGIPFHFKQWGEFLPHGQASRDGSINRLGNPDDSRRWHSFGDGETSWRVNKSYAGRALDGVLHDAMPA